jgi:YD repeat-containing protein
LVIAFVNAGGSLRRETWLNTGAGWLRDSRWDLPTHLWTYENDKHRQTAQLADVNGDGLPDLVQAFENSSGVNRQVTWLNSGHGFPDTPESSAEWSAPREVWSYYQNAPRTKATFVDVDGDGAADFVRAYRASATSLETHLGGGRAEPLRAITDGLGGRVEIEYASLSDPDVHVAAARAAYPEASMRQARTVVHRVGVGASAAELRWTAHRYGDLRAHRLLGIELGFAWHEALDEASGLATTRIQRQDWPLHGLVAREETTATSVQGSMAVQRTSHTLQAIESPGVCGRARRAQAALRADGGWSPICGRRAVRCVQGTSREAVDFGDGFAHDADPTATMPRAGGSALAGASTSPQRAGSRTSGAASRRAGRARPARAPHDPGDRPALRVDTDWSATHSATDRRTVRGRLRDARSASFDGRGRFTGSGWPAGRASVTQSSALRLPIAQLGPDPTVPETRFAYDALGRLVATTRADGVTTSIDRTACAAACPAGAALAVRSSAPGAPTVTLYLDALDRERRRETDGFDGRAVRAPTRRARLVVAGHNLLRGQGAHRGASGDAWASRLVVAPGGAETRWGTRRASPRDASSHTAIRAWHAREVVETVDANGWRLCLGCLWKPGAVLGPATKRASATTRPAGASRASIPTSALRASPTTASGSSSRSSMRAARTRS